MVWSRLQPPTLRLRQRIRARSWQSLTPICVRPDKFRAANTALRLNEAAYPYSPPHSPAAAAPTPTSATVRNPHSHRLWPAGSCMRGFRTPAGTRNPSPISAIEISFAASRKPTSGSEDVEDHRRVILEAGEWILATLTPACICGQNYLRILATICSSPVFRLDIHPIWPRVCQLFLLYPSLFIQDERMVIHQQLLTRRCRQGRPECPSPDKKGTYVFRQSYIRTHDGRSRKSSLKFGRP